jgi:hypothetical protein
MSFCSGCGTPVDGEFCPTCGARITLPDGKTIHVTGTVADEVEQVARSLSTVGSLPESGNNAAWSAVGVAIFLLAGGGAITLLTAAKHVSPIWLWTLGVVLLVGVWLALAPLLRLGPWAAKQKSSA